MYFPTELPISNTWRYAMEIIIKNNVKTDKQNNWLELLNKQVIVNRSGQLYWRFPDLRFVNMDQDFVFKNT